MEVIHRREGIEASRRSETCNTKVHLCTEDLLFSSKPNLTLSKDRRSACCVKNFFRLSANSSLLHLPEPT